MTKLHELANLVQSIWLDYIRRSFVTSGELQAWIDKGLRGVTSNPSIFEKAIAGSADYDDDLRKGIDKGKSARSAGLFRINDIKWGGPNSGKR